VECRIQKKRAIDFTKKGEGPLPSVFLRLVPMEPWVVVSLGRKGIEREQWAGQKTSVWGVRVRTTEKHHCYWGKTGLGGN